MPKEDVLEYEGIVSEILPNAMFKVKLDNEASVRLFESCGFKKKYYILEKDDAS